MNKNTVNIKSLNAQDINDYLDRLSLLLQNGVNDGASIGFIAPLHEQDAKNYWQAVQGSIKEGNTYLLIALINDNVVGSVQLAVNQKPNGKHRAEIEKLMVSSDYRQRGIASMLMSEIEILSKQLGLRLLILDTREGDKAEQLYNKLGYVKVGIIPEFALSSEGTYDGTVLFYKLIPTEVDSRS